MRDGNGRALASGVTSPERVLSVPTTPSGAATLAQALPGGSCAECGRVERQRVERQRAPDRGGPHENPWQDKRQ